MKSFETVYKDTNENVRASKGFAEKTREKLLAESATASFSLKKLLAVLAAVVVLTVLFTGTVYTVSYFRQAKLSESAQFSSATDMYTEKVGRSVEHDGISFTLSEALYENGRLYVTFNCQSEKHSDAFAIFPSEYSTLLIDGVDTPCTVIGVSSDNSGVLLHTLEYDLTEIPLDDNHNFAVGFMSAEVMNGNGNPVTVNGPWEYSFSLNVSTLDSETVIYNIEREFKLANGDTLIIDKLVCTPLSQRIYYTVNTDKNNGFAFSARLSAVDEKGVCQFEFIEMNSNNGQSVNIYPDDFNTDTESFSLSVTVTDRYDNVLLAPTDILCEKQN